MVGTHAGPHHTPTPADSAAQKTARNCKFFFRAGACSSRPPVTALVVILVVFLVVILVFFLVQTGFLKRKRGGKKMTGVDDLVRTSSA